MKYLKIKTLEKRWYDKDEVLLHAVFQILTDFIEQEKAAEIVDWNTDELNKRAWKEINSLYKWWKEIRPLRKNPLDNKNLIATPLKFEKIPGSDLSKMVEPDKKKYAKYYKALEKDCKLEAKWNEEDQKNLHRLIEVRSFLWT